MFFIGLILLAAGGSLGWYSLRRLKSWIRVDGTVVGVHEGEDEQGKEYRALLRYVDPAGKTKEMLSDSGKRTLEKIRIGDSVQIAIDPSDDTMTATVGTTKVLATIGFVLFALGIGLVGFDIRQSGVDDLVPLLIAVVVVIAMAWNFITPLYQMSRDPAMRAAAREDRVRRQQESTEDEIGEFELMRRVQAEERTRARQKETAALISYPIRFVLGLALLIVAGPWAIDRLTEEWSSVRTLGVVVHYESTSGFFKNGRFTIPGYHAVVEYRAAANSKRTAVDWLGTRGQPFAIGASVPVKYVAGSPDRVAIDRGAWNWAPALAVFLFGLLLIVHSLWGFMTIIGRRKEAARTS